MTSKIAKLFPNAKMNEPLCNHTSFNIGGPADVFIEPKDPDILEEIISKCKAAKIGYTILGSGTNTLVLDGGIRGLVISTKRMIGYHFIAGDLVSAWAGAKLQMLAYEACTRSLGGLEFFFGIPGTIGGAVYMNSGAYGSAIGDVVECVGTCDGEMILKKDLGFGYRKSALMGSGLTILVVVLKLYPGNGLAIAKKTKELNDRREASQPLEIPSAGSFFKRPKEGFAAEMIDKCGLKGFRVGGAMVSTKHAGFIVNTGSATAKDVLALMEVIQKKVQERYGVMLEPEVRILGE